MSKFTFSKATKKSARLRMALMGPAGAGKTYSALAIATALAQGKRVAVIDTENKSASKYAGEFDFDILELEYFAPRTYVEALHAAVAEGYEVIVVDSLSHAWMGKGGALEMVDAKAGGGRGSFDAWRSVTPEQNALVDAIIRCPSHLVVTLRSKMDYVIDEAPGGKKTIRKVGLAPEQRAGLEYEFDVVGDISLDHTMSVTKTRCSALADRHFLRPGADVAKILRAWLTDGAPAPAQARDDGEPAAPAPLPDGFEKAVAELKNTQPDAPALWMNYRGDDAWKITAARERGWGLLVAKIVALGHKGDAKAWLTHEVKHLVAEAEKAKASAAPAGQA